MSQDYDFEKGKSTGWVTGTTLGGKKNQLADGDWLTSSVGRAKKPAPIVPPQQYLDIWKKLEAYVESLSPNRWNSLDEDGHKPKLLAKEVIDHVNDYLRNGHLLSVSGQKHVYNESVDRISREGNTDEPGIIKDRLAQLVSYKKREHKIGLSGKLGL